MLDLVFVLGTFVFFGVCWAYARSCDQIYINDRYPETGGHVDVDVVVDVDGSFRTGSSTSTSTSTSTLSPNRDRSSR